MVPKPRFEMCFAPQAAKVRGAKYVSNLDSIIKKCNTHFIYDWVSGLRMMSFQGALLNLHVTEDHWELSLDRASPVPGTGVFQVMDTATRSVQPLTHAKVVFPSGSSAVVTRKRAR